jgi:hypothetical protein
MSNSKESIILVHQFIRPQRFLNVVVRRLAVREMRFCWKSILFVHRIVKLVMAKFRCSKPLVCPLHPVFIFVCLEQIEVISGIKESTWRVLTYQLRRVWMDHHVFVCIESDHSESIRPVTVVITLFLLN